MIECVPNFSEGRDVGVVSGAAGATGAVAGQVAKARGAGKVVGIAGGPEKCAEVVERYGFDECLDYREENLRQRLRAACPSGVDLYFDNVGGEILDTVLTTLALRARIVLCGACLFICSAFCAKRTLLYCARAPSFQVT